MIECVLSCFKQLPLNFTYILLPVYFSVGGRLLSNVLGVLITSLDCPLDSYNEI